MGFPCGSDGKEYAAMPKTQVQFQGQEDPLEKGTATLSIILAWRISWTEKPGRLQSMGSQESDATQQLNNNNERKGQVIKNVNDSKNLL